MINTGKWKTTPWVDHILIIDKIRKGSWTKRFQNPIKLMSGNTRPVLKCRRHRIVYSFQQRSTRHGEIVQPRPKRRNCVAGFLPPPALFLSVKHSDDGDDDEDDDDYNLPSKMFFSIKQSVSILFSFTMLLLFMFGTFAFFIISLDLFCSNIAGPSLIEINEKLLAQNTRV